ncbi:MAG: hypothetical protein L3J97_02435 [Thermoplasmata archaeon]|nr:hypothetical protein [Thermoplasmata archaeon]
MKIGVGSSYSANPNVLVNPRSGALYLSYVTGVTYCGYNAYCAAKTAAGSPYSGNVVVATSTANGTVFSTTTVAFSIRLNQTFGPFFNPAPQLGFGSRFWDLDLAFVGGVTATGLRNGIPTSSVSIDPTLYFYYSKTNGSSWTSQTASRSAILNPAITWGGLANSTQLLDVAILPTFGSNVYVEATVFNGSVCLQLACGVEETVALNSSNNGTTWSGPFVLNGAVPVNGTNGSWRAYWSGEYQSAISYGSTRLFAWSQPSCPTYSTTSSRTPTTLECGKFSSAATGFAWTLPGTTTVAVSAPYTGTTTSVTFSPALTIPGNASWTLWFMGTPFKGNGSANTTVTNVPVGVPMLFNASTLGLWNLTSYYRGWKGSLASPATFSTSASVSFTFAELVPLTLNEAPSTLLGKNCYEQQIVGTCPKYSTPPGPFSDQSALTLDPYNCQGTYCSSPPSGATSSNAGDLGCVSYIYPYSIYYNEFGYQFETIGCDNAYVSINGSGSNPVSMLYGTPTWIQTGVPYTMGASIWSPMDVLCNQAGTPPPAAWLAAAQASGSYWYDEYFCYYPYIPEITPLAWFGSGSGSVTSKNSNISIVPTGPLNETIDWQVNGVCEPGQSYYAYWEEYGVGTTTYTYKYNYTKCVAQTTLGPPSGGGSSIPLPLTASETGLPTGVKWGISLTSGTTNLNQTTTKSSMTFGGVPTGPTFQVAVATIPDPKTGLYWVGTTNATVTMPDFTGLFVTFTERSLAGLTYQATVTETGLPTGAGWTLSELNKSSATTSSIVFPPGSSVPYTQLSIYGGVSYTFNGSNVYTTSGTAYYVSSVQVNESSINYTATALPPWQSSLTAVGPATVVLVYSPMYWLTVTNDTGGHALVSSQWVPSGNSVILTASVQSGATKYEFAGWVGLGPGGVSGLGVGTSYQITVKPGGPVTEFAHFRPVPLPTWNFTVLTSGLPLGQNHTIIVDGRAFSGTGSFLVTNVTTGDHNLSAAAVYSEPSVTTMYVPTSITTSSGSTEPVFVRSDVTVTVTYATEYLLSVTSTAGGTVTGALAGAWVTPGSTKTLTAVPNAGYYFVSWNGTGSGSITGNRTTVGASISVTVNGPLTELAQFAKIPKYLPWTYWANVTETGLPAGVQWNATVGVVGGTSGTATIVLSKFGTSGLNGTYTLTVPTVYGATGVRYEPNGLSVYTQSAQITSNTSFAVTFTTQYFVTVVVSGGGTVTPPTGWTANGATLSGWVASGATVDLVAAANATSKFVSWNSTAVNSLSATVSFTATSPMTLTATFAPDYHQQTTTNALQGAPISLGLLAALLVVGLIVGFVLFRRGGGGRGMSADRASSAPSVSEVTAEAPTWEEPQGTEESTMDSGAPMDSGDGTEQL